ncbi:MAG: DNA polymerase II large subunit [Nanopusillaceae archaeon]
MNINEYFDNIKRKFFEAYEIAKKAREKGYDPVDNVEISYSEDMAERVEKLMLTINPIIEKISLTNKIREIEKLNGPLTFSTILEIANYVSDEIYKLTNDKLLSIELALRTAFAYHTLGVVAAPTEGIAKVCSKKRRDGKEYIAVYYAGPVRSAGGTPTAFSVVIADFLRKKFGYMPYDPTEEEILRSTSEVFEYKRLEHLQYTPKPEELRYVIERLPVEVTGIATLESEVSSYKDLPRIETNKIRGGMVLVLAEGLCQKAEKLWKKLEPIADKYNLSDWKWLKDFKSLKEKLYSSQESSQNDIIKASWKYLSQITAGRPVISLPSQRGGFRLRYGKSRTNGHSAISIHPSLSILLFNFLAYGTQLPIERPRKSGVVTFSDTLEPPIVRLKDGSVIKVTSEKIAKKIMQKKLLDKILFLGDILITYGDFVQGGHPLVPAGYCEEWWVQEFMINATKKTNFLVKLDYKKPLNVQEISGLKDLAEFLSIEEKRLEKILRYPLKFKPTLIESLKISLNLDVPLHPAYTFHWKDISYKDIIDLIEILKNKAKIFYSKKNFIVKIAKLIEIEKDEKVKKILEEALIPHLVKNNKIIIKYPYATALLVQLGYLEKIPKESNNGFEAVESISLVKIRDKVGTYIGARMGRPEKAKIREMEGSPMVLFPVGDEGGRMRNLLETANYGSLISDLKTYYCEKCNILTPYTRCIYCNSKTILIEEKGINHKRYEIAVKEYIDRALKNLKIDSSQLPKVIKGVRGLSSKNKHPERLEKGIIRSKYNLFVFRDGTIRFDAIEAPITYFRPKDLVYVSIEKLRELGYEKDIYGNPLEREDQILELKPQDVILPTIGRMKKGSKVRKDGFLKTIINATKFVDDLLERFYKLPKYYNVKKPEDLLGHLIIVIAPHTSAGVVGRIIGFSRTQTLLMHPLMHAGIRRNCDGDEGGIILLLDALINFSREYLPQKTGGSMDAPLVVTLKLKGMEVDDEVHDFDTYWFYPLEFYESTLQYKSTDSVNIETFKKRLGKEEEYTNWGFLHDIVSISKCGNKVSSYKTIKAMLDKLKYQLNLANYIRASDPSIVAKLVIELHFARDVKGNLRKFSEQEFRCTKCNTKYRRIPLSGKCEKCGGRLTFTVHYGTITKYLDPSLWLAEKINLDEYSLSSLKALKLKVYQTFGSSTTNKSIMDFFNNSFNNNK